MSTDTVVLDGAAPERRRGAFSRLYRGETTFDFVGRRRWWFGVSALIIGLGLDPWMLLGRF